MTFFPAFFGGNRIPTNCVDIKFTRGPASPAPPKRLHVDGWMMEMLARDGFYWPIIHVQKDLSVLVWIRCPEDLPNGAPDIVIPPQVFKRGKYLAVKKYVRGHHRFYQLQANAARQLAMLANERSGL